MLMRSTAGAVVISTLASMAAFADVSTERVQSIQKRLDARKGDGEALTRSIKTNFRVLRDVTRRATRAGLSLPPVIVKGGSRIATRPKVGFGAPIVVFEERASIQLTPDAIIWHTETRDTSEGQRQWEPKQGGQKMAVKLTRFRSDRIARRALMELGVNAQSLELAFDRWTQFLDKALEPEEPEATPLALPAPPVTPAQAN